MLEVGRRTETHTILILILRTFFVDYGDLLPSRHALAHLEVPHARRVEGGGHDVLEDEGARARPLRRQPGEVGVLQALESPLGRSENRVSFAS